MAIGASQQISGQARVAGAQPVYTASGTQALRFSADAPVFSDVVSRKEGSTQFITINRPEAGNRITPAMLGAMETFFDTASQDPKIKTIVFESTDKRFFSPGLDIFPVIKSLQETSKKIHKGFSLLPKSARKEATSLAHYAALRGYITRGFQFYNRIEHSPKVTIAKLNGATLGGGTELSMACDYIIASDKVTIGLPELKYGLFPAWGGTERVTQRVGHSLSKFFILEGGLMSKGGVGTAILSAQEALEMGMVDKVVPLADLDKTVQEGIADGQYAKKASRATNKAAIKALDTAVRNRLKTPKLIEKLVRYQTASLDELLQEELKGLSRRALALAIRRIEGAPKVSRLTHERDLFRMLRTFSQQTCQPES